MQLVCAILADVHVAHVLAALTAAGHRATRVSSTGGLVRRGNTTLLIGVERDQLEAALRLVREACPGSMPGATSDGCATLFVLNVEGFQQI